MIKGLYAAATGMVAIEDRQAVVANNIANASTAGFKRQNPVQEGFHTTFVGKLTHPSHFNWVAGPAGGAKVTETYSDLSAGPVRQTGNALNVALHGPGYLAVDTPAGTRFTRAGDLTIDADGDVATQHGHKVQDVGGGAIAARGGRLVIKEDGLVTVDGVPRGQMRMVEFDRPHQLTREGYTLYAASGDALQRSRQATDTRVIQEYLEMSNVNLAREMIDMTLGLRAYAANQKVITTMDETMGRLIDQVGMPA